MYIQTIVGKDLMQSDANLLYQTYKRTFGNGEVDMSINYTFGDELFFLAREEDKILAAGSLKPIQIIFMERKYDIQGIGGIVALEKGKGYGKFLMQGMRDYLIENKLFGIGLCAKKNTPFYRKCDFFVEEDLVKRFIYLDKDGNISHCPDMTDEDVLYIQDNENLIQSTLTHPEENIYVPTPKFW